MQEVRRHARAWGDELEKRVDEWGDGGALSEQQQASEYGCHDQQRQQPVFLAGAEKEPEFAD